MKRALTVRALSARWSANAVAFSGLRRRLLRLHYLRVATLGPEFRPFRRFVDQPFATKVDLCLD